MNFTNLTNAFLEKKEKLIFDTVVNLS